MYNVIIERTDGPKLIARCEYIADAESVLRNWNTGRITQGSEVLVTKKDGQINGP